MKREHPIGKRAMRKWDRWVRSGVQFGLLLAAVIAAPAWFRSAEPLEIIREAFRASSDGLASGTGKGRYRYYEAVPGSDWKLKVDADLQTFFDGKKYHIDFAFRRDDLWRETSRRIIYAGGDGVTCASFTPATHPTGARAFVFTPERYGDGLSRPASANFPWDVTKLSRNVWDVERLIKNIPAERIKIRQTPEGDLVGSYPLTNIGRDRVRFECLRQFGFNITKKQDFVVGEDHPRHEYSLRWKRNSNGLWYVTSLQESFELHNEMDQIVKQIRSVMMYSRFEPNARVASSMFTEESLQMPEGSPIVDARVGDGSKRKLRVFRKR
jgi:hypothetical protein